MKDHLVEEYLANFHVNDITLSITKDQTICSKNVDDIYIGVKLTNNFSANLFFEHIIWSLSIRLEYSCHHIPIIWINH